MRERRHCRRAAAAATTAATTRQRQRERAAAATGQQGWRKWRKEARKGAHACDGISAHAGAASKDASNSHSLTRVRPHTQTRSHKQARQGLHRCASCTGAHCRSSSSRKQSSHHSRCLRRTTAPSQRRCAPIHPGRDARARSRCRRGLRCLVRPNSSGSPLRSLSRRTSPPLPRARPPASTAPRSTVVRV